MFTKIAKTMFLLTATPLMISYGAMYYAFEDLRDNPRSILQANVKLLRVAYAGSRIVNIYFNDAQEMKQKHTKASKILKQAFKKNAGLYLKFGQLIASLDTIVPDEYRKQLVTLTYDCPRSSFQDVKQTIESETGKKLHQVFLRFADTPLASASIAQVHRAKLLDGRDVAVKVQHKGLIENTKCDIEILRACVKIGEWIFPDFRFMWLIEQLSKNLPKQLDFRKEAHNLSRISRLLEDEKYVKIPKIYGVPTQRLLMMQFMEGVHIHDIKAIDNLKINKRKLANNLSKVLTKMVYVYGFVHGDPHSGNILVRRKEGTKDQAEIILLDHGLYQELNESTKNQYCKLWLGILTRHQQMIFEAAEVLGTKNPKLFCAMLTSRKYETLKGKSMDKFLIKKQDTPELQALAKRQTVNINNVLNQINRELLLLFKVNDFSRNLQNMLGGREVSVYLQVAKCCFQNQHTPFLTRYAFILGYYWNLWFN